MVKKTIKKIAKHATSKVKQRKTTAKKATTSTHAKTSEAKKTLHHKTATKTTKPTPRRRKPTANKHLHHTVTPRNKQKPSLYARMSHKRRLKKDEQSRQLAEYRASLPKHPVKRFFYKLHPKRVLAFWFSKRGFFLSLKIVAGLTLIVAVGIAGIFSYYRKDLESIRPEKIAERVQTTVSTYYDRNGVVLWEDKGTENYRLTVESKDISDYVKKATVAIEDQTFYDHEGISVTGIARSLFNNTRGGSTQGGSTLTQQLVKQVFLAEEAKKRGIDGIPRKIKEVLLAIEVERVYNKEQILTLYLNESPYGGRRNGVESAAQTYFSKSAKELNLAESALLAAIPNQPGLFDPYNKAGNAALIARQHKVLDHMVELEYVTQEEADKAKKIDILKTIKPVKDQLDDIKAPHFVLMVRSQLERELGEAIVGRGGLSIKTTLDYRAQKMVQESMDKMFSSSTPTWAGFTNGAVTVEDVKTGQIVALLGSRSFDYPGFGQDNAATAFIQPGSTIKPLVYAELFNNRGPGQLNFGSGSILADDKSMNAIYGAPLRNADGGYKGGISIRRSLALSRNVPAVKAMHISGIQPTWDTIRGLGNNAYCTQGQEVQAGLSSAIGGCGTRQIDHVNAFASLARGGVYKPYSTILQVKNAKGDVLKSYKDTSGERVIDSQAAYIVSDILSDDAARAGLVAPGKYGFVIPGVRTATKTGTTDRDGNAKDIWTMSYSSSLAMGVWLGNSDNTILQSGNSTIPAILVGDVMGRLHTELYQPAGKWSPGDWVARPNGIQVIGGELYPSYYNINDGLKKTKVTFDKVSKKRATDCTPSSARVEVELTAYKDPITKKERYLSVEGYLPDESDDIHQCGDTKPSVSISPSSDGSEVTISYIKGTHPLKNVSLVVNGVQIANLSVKSSGTKTVPNTVSDTDFNAEAIITDSAYYSGSSSATWSTTPVLPTPSPTPVTP